ncbi:MAG: prepilin-type N-terminal cleavage/methylation domain-containing protein [Planctomycetes bacterium]|nr:prepilin-type N-terminal cleavage/methylation domain-containing protein [Planctomycetota bacterium]
MKKMASRRGFTLLELMIAVAILVVVIIATSQIFGTVGKVAALGEATADVLQEAAAIERQIRADIERLSSEGVFAIRCVSVRNGIHFGAGGPLLNPLLPENAIIRADQLVFFTNGIQGIQTYRQGAGSNHKGQGTAARIYYGHAFQIPGAGAVDDNNKPRDPIVDLNNPIVPWYYSTDRYQMVRTDFSSTNSYDPEIDGGFIVSQPTAQEWLLSRQAILLVDDDGDPPDSITKTRFLNNNISAYWIDDAVIRNGRVDAAASQLNDIRNEITLLPNGNFREWYASGASFFMDQRTVIADQVLFYPRAERVAPGMHRIDQALTNNVLGSGCSSFIVDWTYEDGVGYVEQTNPLSPALFGVVIDSSREQPWFGLDADFNGDGNLDRGVLFYDADPSDRWWTPAATIDPENVEELVIDNQDLQVYEAFFGYNQSQALNNIGVVDSTLGYTPWPSAIRITMVLHDPKSKLENGRVVQFVINLPKRAQ